MSASANWEDGKLEHRVREGLKRKVRGRRLPTNIQSVLLDKYLVWSRLRGVDFKKKVCAPLAGVHAGPTWLPSESKSRAAGSCRAAADLPEASR